MAKKDIEKYIENCAANIPGIETYNNSSKISFKNTKDEDNENLEKMGLSYFEIDNEEDTDS